MKQKEVYERALNRLPEKKKLVLSLAWIEKLSTDEVGKILDMEGSRVKALVDESLEDVRQYLCRVTVVEQMKKSLREIGEECNEIVFHTKLRLRPREFTEGYELEDELGTLFALTSEVYSVLHAAQEPILQLPNKTEVELGHFTLEENMQKTKPQWQQAMLGEGLPVTIYIPEWMLEDFEQHIAKL